MHSALAAVMLLAQASPLVPSRTIHASGEGHAYAVPDIARLVLGVEAQDPQSLGRANTEATNRMKKVLATLEKSGVAAKDIRTIRYSVDVLRSYTQPNQGAVIGYRVVNQVLVTLRDLSRLGALLDEVVVSGANEITSLSMEKEDIAVDRARALEIAVSDARTRASVLAKAAGATLGEVVEVNEGFRSPIVPTPVFAQRMSAGSNSVPVNAGELDIAATVQVTFAIR
jgi:uncharacterized protein YggE